MKKKNKKNHIRMRFSTLLLCCLAILLCDAPCGAEIIVDIEETLNVGTGMDMDVDRIENDYLSVKDGGTVNLYTGAYVAYGIYADAGSVVNIYAGELGPGYSIILMNGSDSTAVVTVYGTDFAVDWDRDGTADPLGPSETEFTPLSCGAVLEGTYKNGDSINLVFLSIVPIHLVNLDPEVEIDIKPGSDDNSINLKSRGVVPVAILSDSDTNFDATAVDPAKVFFAGAGVAVRGKGNKYLASKEYVNDDDLLDLVVKVETKNLVPGEFAEGGAYLRIHETSDQASPVLYEGWDEIKIVPPE